MKEIEMKFAVKDPKIFDMIAALKNFEGFKAVSRESMVLDNFYLDSEDYALLRNGAAFRIRQKGFNFQITFKQGSKTAGGSFVREEIEEEIDNPDEELKKIARGTSVLPSYSAAKTILRGAKMKQVLMVRTERTAIILRKGREKMELALDRVNFFGENKSASDFEIELENKGARAESFKKVFEFLQKEFSLLISESSKYARGIELLRKNKIYEYDLEIGILKAVQLIKELGKKLKRTVIMAVAGGSASGKTSQVAKKASNQIPDSVIISIDDYYQGAEFMAKHPDYTWDQPEAVDLDLLERHFIALKKGESIQKPIYSKKTGNRKGYKTVHPAPVIIVEGIFALHPQVARHADLKIFVEIGTHGRLLRRLLRDAGGGLTGQSFRDVLEYFLKTVAPMHETHIEPTKDNADIIIHNEYDPDKESGKSFRHEVQAKYQESISETTVLGLGGKKVGSGVQTDVYYTPKNKDLADSGEIMRIREEKGEYFLTYKGPLLSDELRIKPKIDIPIEQEHLQLLEREYIKVLEIRKKRKEFLLDGIIIAFDEVEKLGSFVEFKSASKEEGTRIKALANKLGITSRPIKKSYFDLVCGQ